MLNFNANKVLNFAMNQIGYTGQKYNNWYYNNNQKYVNEDWCVVFIQYVFTMMGAPKWYLSNGTMSASCGYVKSNHPGKQVALTDLKPGDIVLFDWNKNGKPQHIGIVEDVGSACIYSIEGNTGANPTTVMTRQRNFGDILYAFRPEYISIPDKEEPKEETEVRYQTLTECPDWASEALVHFIECGVLKGNEKGLDLSEDMLRILVMVYRITQL